MVGKDESVFKSVSEESIATDWKNNLFPVERIIKTEVVLPFLEACWNLHFHFDIFFVFRDSA